MARIQVGTKHDFAFFNAKASLEEILEKMTDDGHAVLAVPGTEKDRKDMDRLMKEFIKKDKEKRGESPN
jgi:3-dehydroquinate dehydratase